jgi:quinol monooxygenase YgiN
MSYKLPVHFPPTGALASGIAAPVLHTVPMTFANVGSRETKPGQRDAVVSILIRPMAGLKEAGCLLYEVGVSDAAPDTVFVSELWESPEAHRASLELDSVQAAISEAIPLLSGEMGGHQFTVLGSPLR